MTPPVWVRAETVLALHEQLVAEFGGLAGVRDLGLLESALARPENEYGYGAPTIFDLAASYGFGIVRNHPFADGNKRTGFAVAVLFVELNGYLFAATETDATVKTLALAAGELDQAQYAEWIAASAKPSKR